MIVTVDLSRDAGDVGLRDPGDCSRFHVAVQGPQDDRRLADALTAAGVGRMDGAEALVDVAAVRRLAEGRVGADWDSEFARMLDYAMSKGWMHGDAIQAHVEWETA
jgi:hypothetical protein